VPARHAPTSGRVTNGRGADDDAQAGGVTGDADTEIVDIGAEDK